MALRVRHGRGQSHEERAPHQSSRWRDARSRHFWGADRPGHCGYFFAAQSERAFRLLLLTLQYQLDTVRIRAGSAYHDVLPHRLCTRLAWRMRRYDWSHRVAVLRRLWPQRFQWLRIAMDYEITGARCPE